MVRNFIVSQTKLVPVWFVPICSHYYVSISGIYVSLLFPCLSLLNYSIELSNSTSGQKIYWQLST